MTLSKHSAQLFTIANRLVDSANRLTHLGQDDIVLGERREPLTFFKSRSSLTVNYAFFQVIAMRAQAIEADTVFGVNFHETTRDGGMTDAEIEAALGDGHIMDESTSCALVAEMISVRESGKPGLLHSHGLANLFYTSALVVNVTWYAADGVWIVDTSGRSGDRWRRGSRIFTLRR